MAPRDFLTITVDQNIAEQAANPADIRLAFNAVAAVDALAAHMYVWLLTNTPSVVAGIADDTVYRHALGKLSIDFDLIRDTAKAQKHVHLTRGTPGVSSANQMAPAATGWNQAGWGDSSWGGAPQAAVQEQGQIPYRCRHRETRAGFPGS